MNKEYLDIYKNLDVLKSIQTQVVFREMAFINPAKQSGNPSIRYMSANTIDLILKNMKNFRFNERNYNIYRSLARFDFSLMNKELGIPPISFNFDKRESQKKIFLSNFSKYILTYDFCIDFDFDELAVHKSWSNEVIGFKALYDDVKLVKNQFDIRKIHYSLIFSGRGFYIIVPGKYFWDKLESPFEKIVKFSNNLKNILSIDSMDCNIYDLRRVVKCCDTVDIRSGNICVPLTDEDFINFDLKNKKPSPFYFRDYSKNTYLRQGEDDSFINYIKELI